MKIKSALGLIIFMSILGPNTISAAIIKFGSLPNVAKQGTVYIIDHPIDLNEEIVQIAPNSTVRFTDGGYINNGTLIGDDTKIKADKDNQIFTEDLIIQGSWNNTRVYSEWVGLNGDGTSNDQQFSNLMTLSNGHKLTHLYVQEGDFYVSAHNGSAPIILPSNVYWHNKARIHMMATNLSKYNIILISKVNNVTIDGGEFIGDLDKHLGDDGEWGHGIKCGGASKITLRNLTCSYCWGDGIDLIEGRDDNGEATIPNKNIVIENVKCLYNRRQGMSIEAAHNVKVVRSDFMYTGRSKSTAPSAGVDIEPWINNGDKVKDVSFINCQMNENIGYDFQCEPNLKLRGQYKDLHNNITLKGCNIGRARIQFTNGLTTQKSRFEESLLIQYADSLIFKDSFIKKKTIKHPGKYIKIKKCKGDTNTNLEAWIPVLGFGAILVGCRFAYLGNKNKYGNENNRNYNNS